MNLIFYFVFLMMCDHGFASSSENFTCGTINGEDMCICNRGFFGVPPDCDEECELNSDCSTDKYCINYYCEDPCLGTCALTATCSVVSHFPICACPDGTTGNPYKSCLKNNQEYNGSLILKYSEKKNVLFDCAEYLEFTENVQIGWVNPKMNLTTIFNTTTLDKNFTMADNGSTLGCIVIVLGNDKKFNFSMEQTKILICEDKIEPKSSYSVVIATVAGGMSLIVIATTTILCCKYRRNRRKTQQTPKLPAVNYNPFYSNLLFREQCQREIEALEKENEPIYEEIL